MSPITRRTVAAVAIVAALSGGVAAAANTPPTLPPVPPTVPPTVPATAPVPTAPVPTAPTPTAPATVPPVTVAPAPTAAPTVTPTTVFETVTEADMFGTGTSGSGPEYPECGPGALFDTETVTCVADPAPIPPGTIGLRTNLACPIEGDFEGAFTSAAEMALLLECILPVATQWMQYEYGTIATPPEWGAVSPSLLPNNFIYVPTGVSGTHGCDFSDRSLSYCMLDGNVYLGEQQIWADYNNHGDADMWGSISHEMGHRIQHLAGSHIPGADRELIPTENQADCFSGAFLDYAARFGLIDSSATGDDLIDLFVGLFNIGEPDSDQRTHGTIDQRIRAFFVGYNSADNAGAFACAFYVTDLPIVPVSFQTSG